MQYVNCFNRLRFFAEVRTKLQKMFMQFKDHNTGRSHENIFLFFQSFFHILFSHYHFLKECNENFHLKYVNCFNRLRFLPKVGIKLQKCVFFLYNLKTITHEGNLKTREMTSLFLFHECLKHSIWYLKIVKIHFHLVLLLVSSGL